MARPGRPRANPEQKILAEMSEDEKRVEAILAEKLKSSAQSGFRMAFEAACVLHTLERGTQYQRALCERAIRGLRRTQWARANDPYGKLPDPEFLERFIEGHAPGGNWRESARIGEIENENYERENERLAKMHAD